MPTASSPLSADPDTGVLSKGASWGIMVAIGPGALLLLILFLVIKCRVDAKRRRGLAREQRRSRIWWGRRRSGPVCDAPNAPVAVGGWKRLGEEGKEEDVGMATLVRVAPRKE